MNDIAQVAPPKQGWTLRVYSGEDRVMIMLDGKTIEMSKRQALALADKIDYHLKKAIVEEKYV